MDDVDRPLLQVLAEEDGPLLHPADAGERLRITEKEATERLNKLAGSEHVAGPILTTFRGINDWHLAGYGIMDKGRAALEDD